MQGRQYFMYRTSNNFFEKNILITPSAPIICNYSAPEDVYGEIVFFVSCDSVYYHQAAIRLIKNFYQWGEKYCLHLNVVNPTDETVASLADLKEIYPYLAYSFINKVDSMVKESSHQWNFIYKKTLYACSRFLILPDLMKIYNKTIVVLDADTVCKSPVAMFVEKFSKKFNHEIGVKFNENLLGPGRDCEIDILAFSNTMHAFFFATLLRNYILHFFERDHALWMLDQVGFLAVKKYLENVGYAPRTYLFNRDDFLVSEYFAHYGGHQIRESIPFLHE